MRGGIITHYKGDAIITSTLFAAMKAIDVKYIKFFGHNPDRRAHGWEDYADELKEKKVLNRNFLLAFICLDLEPNELDFLYKKGYNCQTVIVGNNVKDFVYMDDDEAPFDQVYRFEAPCAATRMYREYLKSGKHPHSYPLWIKLAENIVFKRRNKLVDSWNTIFRKGAKGLAPDELRKLLGKIRNNTPIGLLKDDPLATQILRLDSIDGSLSRRNRMEKRRRKSNWDDLKKLEKGEFLKVPQRTPQLGSRDSAYWD